MNFRCNALLWTAAIATCAGTASAQSSIRINGIIDAAATYGKGSAGRLTTLSSGLDTPSRIGFSGTEDLGNGYRANFALEAGINNDNGTGFASNTNNQATGTAGGGGLTFNRQSWVGLQSSSLGELRFGRNFNPTFRMYTLYDPFYGGGPGGSQAAIGAIAAYSHPAGMRTSNAIEYWSPPSSIKVHFTHALGENPSNASATADDGRYTGARVSYAAGGFDVGAAYARYQTAALGDMSETILGIKYTFAQLTAYAMYTRNTTGLNGDMDGHLLGLGYRTGPWLFRASYSTSDRENAVGASIGQARKLAVGANYALSVRTELYAHYARNRNSDGASSVPWFGTAVNGPNGTSQVLALGVIHRF